MHFVVAELIIDPTWVAYGYDAYVEVSLCFHWGVAWKLKWLMILRSAACYNAVWMSYNAWGPNQLPERERERERLCWLQSVLYCFRILFGSFHY